MPRRGNWFMLLYIMYKGKCNLRNFANSNLQKSIRIYSKEGKHQSRIYRLLYKRRVVQHLERKCCSQISTGLSLSGKEMVRPQGEVSCFASSPLLGKGVCSSWWKNKLLLLIRISIAFQSSLASIFLFVFLRTQNTVSLIGISKQRFSWSCEFGEC